MQSVPDEPHQRKADLRRQIDALEQRLSLREMRVGELERLAERQMDMLERYDRVVPRFPGQDDAADRTAVSGSARYAHLVDLLDRAVVRAEQATSDKERLGACLDRTLALLDDALKNQERMAAQPAVAASPASATAETEPAAAVEATLARYDAMLERSLAALEQAHKANRDHDRQIGERDRLLSRTLDALESAVGEQGADRAREKGQRGVFNALFG